MVIGEYRTKINEKKRISLPKRLRDELGGDLIITRGYEKSLVLVNKSMWEVIAKEIANGSFINKDIRETSRFLVGSANEVVTDSVGRFVIPTSLVEYAELKNEIIFIGLINWVEIWSKERWEKKLEYLDKYSDEIAQQLTNASSKGKENER